MDSCDSPASSTSPLGGISLQVIVSHIGKSPPADNCLLEAFQRTHTPVENCVLGYAARKIHSTRGHTSRDHHEIPLQVLLLKVIAAASSPRALLVVLAVKFSVSLSTSSVQISSTYIILSIPVSKTLCPF
jgi:hypothetical protein